MRRSLLLSFIHVLAFMAWFSGGYAQEPSTRTLELQARQRVAKAPDSKDFEVVQKQLAWDPAQTALVICDMWDQHWCRGATRRVAEMAPKMNEVVAAAREKGILIIHSPSNCMSFYKDTSMWQRPRAAPKVETEIPLQNWCHLDSKVEAALPIDDSDGGCDCWPPCEPGSPWTRQIQAIEIKEGDAITDSGEAYYLMKQRRIENVVVMGVHTNMCVLGRPFSIRQMVYQGQNVVLMRDMTDTMYNSRMRPYVKHVQGTQLVIEHIEKYWCPTITSTAFTGGKPFRFSEEGKPHAVVMIGEREYRTNETLPEFVAKYLEPRGIRCTIVHADREDGNVFPGLNALKTADVFVLSVRRRALPEEDLNLIRDYVNAGNPLVGIRTANHAFHTHDQKPDGHAEWQEFDREVVGGNYRGHHEVGVVTQLNVAENAGDHPILHQVSVASMVGNGSLYQVSPLAKTATPLLIGTIPNQKPEPVAWTHRFRGGRIVYTSLGHPQDFENESFRRFLANAVQWALAGVNRY